MIKLLEQYLMRVLTIALHFVLVVSLVRIFAVDPGVINGQSMEDTFNDNNAFIVNKAVYFPHTPKRFHVVQFFGPTNSDDLLVKRIIGLPGESVICDGGQMYVRTTAGEVVALDEPYVKDGVGCLLQDETEIAVPEDSYFVAGDNRVQSTDSRHWGAVHRRQITGKVMKLW